MANIDLKKKAVEIVLTKRQLPTPPSCDVALAVDISGSMSNEYRDGLVQDVVERCLAIATKFDQDGKMDVWTFNNSSSYVGTVTEKQIDGFVQRDIVNNPRVDKWGGTSYAPVLSQINEHFFGATKKTGFFGGLFGKKEAEPKSNPVFVMFITDGENNDNAQFIKLLNEFRSRNIYIQIVGIGDGDLTSVQQTAEDEPNVGFCQIINVRGVSDELMIEQLVQQEFVDWIKKF